MSRDKALPPEFDELAHLLDDPQVSEFLLLYLRIRDPGTRAHLRRMVADVVQSIEAPSGRLQDVARRDRLKLVRSSRRTKLQS